MRGATLAELLSEAAAADPDGTAMAVDVPRPFPPEVRRPRPAEPVQHDTPGPSQPGVCRPRPVEPVQHDTPGHGGPRLTYGAWRRRAEALAGGLQHAGISPGERVALVFDAAGWCDYAVAYVAVQKAAAVPVPLHPQVGGIELARVLRDCGASVIVAPPGLPAAGPTVRVLRPGDLEETGRDGPAAAADRPSSLAEILYTPRALSPPVALARSHQELTGGPLLAGEPAEACQSLLHALPVGGLAGQDVLRASLSSLPGGVVVVPSFDLDRFCALLSGATGRGCVLQPSIARALLDSGVCARYDLSRVPRVVLTSGRVPPGLLHDLAEAFRGASLILVDVLGRGPQGPRGAGHPSGVRTVLLHDRARPGALGRPQRGTGVWVGDETGQPVEPGTAGRVWMGEPGSGVDVDTGDRGSLDPDGLLRLLDADARRRSDKPLLPAEPVDEPRKPTPEAAGPPPVAFSQEGMLWHEHFAPGCQNLPGLARRYRGPLDVDALARALDEIVRRHDALRTTFALRDHRLVQIVRPHRRLPLPRRDLAHLPAGERDATVARLVAEAGQRPFDLVDDALFEPTLLRLGDDDHVLLIRTHHSVFDDWSVGVFRRELSALYTAFRDGVASPLPELALQFPDFARRQRRELAGRAWAREMAFWRAELAGAPLTTQLPVDDPERPEGSPQPAGEPVSLTVPPDLHERLRNLARRQRATVFMTMLAAYGALVHRYTGQEDLLLATVVANRNHTDLEGLIGCFTKKVPLRLRLGGDPSFTEALTRTRTALMGALAHQDLPFEAVVQGVLGAPAAAHGLVPHVVLMFQGETPRHELHLPDVDTVGFETSTTASRAHFMAGPDEEPAERQPAEPWGAGLYGGTFVIVSVAASPDRLSCIARGAFHAPAVRRLLESFRVLLEGATADPDRPLSRLPLLDAKARADVRQRRRGPVVPLPGDTLAAAFAAQVRRAPDAVAVRSRAEALTFADLDIRVTRLARRLRMLGAEAGATVGICLGPSADLLVAVLAVWKAGAAWLALDPDDADDRLARIVEAASVSVVVGGDARGTLARSCRVVAAPAEGGATGPDPAPDPELPGPGAGGLREPAVVFCGSGPSAIPRGVVLDQRAVLNLWRGLRRDVHQTGEGEETAAAPRAFLCPPPTSDGFLRQLVALLDGHTLHVPVHPTPLDPGAVVSLVRSGAVDVLDATPAELASLLDAGLEDALRDRAPVAVEPVLVVGTRSAVGPELWRAVRGLPRVHAAVLYGPPECAFGATARRASGASGRPSVGRALANVTCSVLAADGEPVPDRALGDLHLAGPSLARGYLGGVEGDDGVFPTGHEAATEERIFRTGHRARCLPDGTVELLRGAGTDTDLRGFAVDLERIRGALAGCPGIGDVHVALHRDEEGGPRLVASGTPEGRAPTLGELRAWLWTRLPGYACPSTLVAVASPPARPDPEQPAALPHERALAGLWAEVLGVDHVDASANYWQRFSFLETLARAREAGLSVAVESVTRNRTVATLAADLAAGARSDRSGPSGARGSN